MTASGYTFHQLKSAPDPAFCWVRSQGDRVVVVLDDDLPLIQGKHLVVSQKSPEPDLEKIRKCETLLLGVRGLVEVFHFARSWPDSKAFGFFTLPSQIQKIPDLVEAIKQWLGVLEHERIVKGLSPLRVFILVDALYGDQGIAKQGKETRRILKQSGLVAKIGILSKAGDAVIEDVSEGPADQIIAISKGTLRNAFRHGLELEPTNLFFEFLQKEMQIEELLWPSWAINWYLNADPPLPHSFSDLSDEKRTKACERALANYLHRLFGFSCSPPKSWFSDREQFEILHQELRNLVGAYALAHGGEHPIRMPTLGAIVILIAVATKSAAHGWISEFQWSKPFQQKEIMPRCLPKARVPAAIAKTRGVIKCLIELLAELATVDGKPEPLIRKVTPYPDRLQLHLGFDFEAQDNADKRDRGEPSLAEKLRNPSKRHAGGVFNKHKALKQILRTSKALLSAEFLSGPDKSTILEFCLCQK